MKFDTEPAFFRAVYGVHGHSPSSIADEVLDRRDVKRKSQLAGRIVDLMRDCFLVHERCTAQPIPENDLLTLAAERASGSLPDGYQVAIWLEKGAGYVNLYGRDGEEIEYPSNHESLADQLSDAIEHVLSLDGGAHDADRTD